MSADALAPADGGDAEQFGQGDPFAGARIQCIGGRRRQAQTGAAQQCQPAQAQAAGEVLGLGVGGRRDQRHADRHPGRGQFRGRLKLAPVDRQCRVKLLGAKCEAKA